VFDLLGRDGARVKALFKDAIEQQGEFHLSADEFTKVASYGFVSAAPASTADRLATIKEHL
jgi:threonine synthase